MIEQREITYEWQSTAGNSRSLKKEDGVLVGTNYVQNPSAEGATSSVTAESGNGTTAIVADSLTGPGTKAYKYTGPGTATNEWTGEPNRSASVKRVNGVKVATNRVRNPRGVGLVYWAVRQNVSLNETTSPLTGEAAVAVTLPSGADAGSVLFATGNSDNAARVQVEANQSYKVSAFVEHLASNPGGAVMGVYVDWYNDSGYLSSSDTGNTLYAQGFAGEISGIMTSPSAATTAEAYVYIYVGDATSGTTVVVSRGYLGENVPYFDGSMTSMLNLGTISSPAPAAAGTPWWFRSTVRLDPTVLGSRTTRASLRFYDSNGVLLQSVDGPAVTRTPEGVFNRWVGTPGASKSEQFVGNTRRINEVPNPSFRLNQAGWSVADNFTLDEDSNTFQVTATADVQAGALVAYTDPFLVTPGDQKSGRMDVAVSVSDDAPSQSLQLLIRFYDAGGNYLEDVYGTGGEVTDTASTLILNGALTPAEAVTYRFVLATVDGTPADTEVLISSALVETSPTVGDYFDGDTASTGTGNWADTFEVSASAVAPAGTDTVRAVVLRVPVAGWESGNDIFYLNSLLLTISSETTLPTYYDGDFPDETIYVNVPRDDELTTDEWFEVDGAALNTYAYNITTAGGSRMSPPEVRGANLVVPGSPGTKYMKKELAGQTISLNMWVQGSEEDGKIPANHAVVQQFKRNWAMLRKLLFHTRREMVITKRWLDWEHDTVLSATGTAEYAGGLEPTMTGGARAVFAVDLYMNDPFFYGEKKTLTGSGSQQKTWREEVPGDWDTRAITVSLAGPRVNPRITVTTAEGDVTWVKYTGTIAKGDTVVLSVKDFTARLNRANGSSTSVLGSVSNGGDKPWLVLGPGQNTIFLESTSGTGATAISYIPVWF